MVKDTEHIVYLLNTEVTSFFILGSKGISIKSETSCYKKEFLSTDTQTKTIVQHFVTLHLYCSPKGYSFYFFFYFNFVISLLTS